MPETRFSPKRVDPKFLLLAFFLGLLVTVAHLASSQTLTPLYSFTGGPSNFDGANPAAGLVLDAQGNLYGTTTHGGRRCCGTVFKVSQSGQEKVLYSFTGAAGISFAGLILDAQGNLYGTTAGGIIGNGTVFRLKKQRALQVLHRFKQAPDALEPEAGLVSDSRGNLYGTTRYGGTGQCPAGGLPGCGTVFKVTPTGTETVLYSFCSLPNCADGAWPVAGLVIDAQGNLYGTAEWGGAVGWGNVFKVTPTGTETVLYSFCSLPNCTDGALPVSGLLMDAQGNLYGTTYGGGAYGSSYCSFYWACGTVFKLAPDGTETVLYNFCSQTNCTDGALPQAGLVSDLQGNLYGTTGSGGTGSMGGTGCGNSAVPGCGIVFKVSPDGAGTTLYRFCSQTNCTDGAVPEAGLAFDPQGNLYGTTYYGGGGCVFTYGCGMVFKLTP